LPEHPGRDFFGFGRCLANVDAAFEPVLKGTFPAATRVNLGFDNDLYRSEFRCDLFRFLWCRSDLPTRGGHAESLE
jgi:hypothetical protein